jgi:8-oxo-dGTP pyrophosphatase MutT (NUDIX family)
MSAAPDWETRLKKALSLELDYEHRRLSGGLRPLGFRDSAVLLLVRPLPGGDAALLLTERSQELETHKGQIAFPGGVTDPEDQSAPSPAIATALRETEEEVGLPRQRVRVLGELPEIHTPSQFQIRPVVGLLTPPWEEPRLIPNPSEIASVSWVSLTELRNPANYRLEWMEFAQQKVGIHVYQVGRYRVWGATGAMIHNFLNRLFMV